MKNDTEDSLSNFTKWAFCTLQFECIHNCPDAPEEEAYLRHPHRHKFHVKAWCRVVFAKDIEFISLRRNIEHFLKNKFYSIIPNVVGAMGAAVAIGRIDLGDRSCEEIAILLINKFNLDACEVSEDGENGAMVARKYGERKKPQPMAQ